MSLDSHEPHASGEWTGREEGEATGLTMYD
jgi:hypothetical protein